MSKNLYHILGVTKTATDVELKSAYRKLARQYHPDVNKGDQSSSDKFKEISGAYDVLGDKEKRKKYDNNEIDSDGKPTGYGAGGYSSRSAGGNPFGGGYGNSGAEFDFSSIFGEDIFSQFSGGGRGGQSNARRPQKGSDVAYSVRVDFLSAALGEDKTLNFAGKNVNVKIPAGTIDAQTLRLKGLGEAGLNGGPSGDALITIYVNKHEYFVADELNVLLDLPISIKEAVLGGKITVPTINGKVMVNIPAYSSSGDKLRLKAKGIKTLKSQGDQIITLKIISPKSKDEKLEEFVANMNDDISRGF